MALIQFYIKYIIYYLLFIMAGSFKNKELLEKAYKELELDFTLDDTKHVYFSFFKGYFEMYYNNTIIPKWYWTEKEEDRLSRIIINKGSKTYYYNNLCEILIWYNYYKYSHRHIQHRNRSYCDIKNKKDFSYGKIYFGIIPRHYLNINRKDGLNLIKEAIDKTILINNGIPNYYNKEELEKYVEVK